MNSQMVFGRSSTIMRNAARCYHTIQRAASASIGAEKPVVVYEALEHASFKTAHESHDWNSNIMASEHKAKFFSLLPFFFEANVTRKHLVIKLEVYPEAGLLSMHTLGLKGVYQSYVPVADLLPITKYDYWCASWRLWAKQN